MSGPLATLALNFMNRSHVHTGQRDFLRSLNENKGEQRVLRAESEECEIPGPTEALRHKGCSSQPQKYLGQEKKIGKNRNSAFGWTAAEMRLRTLNSKHGSHLLPYDSGTLHYIVCTKYLFINSLSEALHLRLMDRALSKASGTLSFILDSANKLFYTSHYFTL